MMYGASTALFGRDAPVVRVGGHGKRSAISSGRAGRPVTARMWSRSGTSSSRNRCATIPWPATALGIGWFSSPFARHSCAPVRVS